MLIVTNWDVRHSIFNIPETNKKLLIFSPDSFDDNPTFNTIEYVIETKSENKADDTNKQETRWK